MRMEEVLPSRGIESTTPDTPTWKRFHLVSRQCSQIGFGKSASKRWKFVFLPPLTHLRVGYLRGLLGQAAALRWNQVVVLGADVLVRIVQTSWAGPRRRAEQTGGEKKSCDGQQVEKQACTFFPVVGDSFWKSCCLGDDASALTLKRSPCTCRGSDD